MKRRKNFLLGSTATHEVRVYPYGKKNVRDDRNVKVRKFSGVSAAMRWAKGNLAYPEVEVVDLTSGRTVFAGGTGKTFNPRKKRKTPKRRDVYAEMAKARKTTKGHTRKDRKRSVARGSSRKPKHKIRLNPFEYEKPNLGAKAFDAAVKKRQAKILGMYRGFLAALDSAGAKKLPSAGEIRDDAMQGAVLIESTRYPELRSQSKEAGGVQAVAAEVLGVGPGGAFAAYVQTYPEIFKLHLKDTVEVLRAKRIEKAKEDYAQERGTKKAAKIEQIEAQIEATRAELDEYEDEDEDEDELDADTIAIITEAHEMTPGEEAEEEQLQEVDQRKKAVKKARKKRKKTVEYEEGEYVPPTEGFSKEKMDRLGKYWQHLSPVRRIDVQPPLNLLGKTRQDVLLYVLKDGTTQVWVKGSMTVTFEPSGKLPSWTIAHRYANRWRGLSPSGSVRGPQKEGDPPVKKSRLRTAVYAAVEGQDKLKKLEDPINIVEKRDRKLKRKQYDMPDLDTYELIGDRANPMDWNMRNWTDAELRYAVKSAPHLRAWDSINMAVHIGAGAKEELERRKREKKKTSPRLRKNSRHGSSPGEMGKWEKTADGYYLPGQAVSFLVKKEAIKVRGRRKQMWSLYANRHEDAWEKGWKLWFNNIPTLTKAKGIVHKYVGQEDEYLSWRGQVSPAGRPPLMPNPRRRKKDKRAEKVAWMRKYTALTGDPQPKPNDYWDTATYLFNIGKTPEEAAERFNARQNPRRRKNTRETEIFFYSDEKQLYAVRSGKWYRLSMPRSREVFGKEAVEHILGEPPGDISTYISQEHWKYLLPKEVPHSRHGPDETAHYRNPKRRKNTWHTETGKMTWKDWCASIRSELRAYGGGWPMQDFKDEVSRLYRKPADEILKELWRSGEHPSDFVSGVVDALRSDRGHERNPKRRKNYRLEDHTKSPYHRVLLRHGMKYGHSVPVTHQGTKVPHHVYRLGSTDFYTSFYTRPGSGVSVTPPD